MSDVAAINQVIKQIQAMKAQAAGREVTAASPSAPSFPETLMKALDKINEMDSTSKVMKEKFEMGDPQVSLADVMIAKEKAGLAFDAAVQVRNRFVQAYQDIMNMPI